MRRAFANADDPRRKALSPHRPIPLGRLNNRRRRSSYPRLHPRRRAWSSPKALRHRRGTPYCLPSTSSTRPSPSSAAQGGSFSSYPRSRQSRPYTAPRISSLDDPLSRKEKARKGLLQQAQSRIHRGSSRRHRPLAPRANACRKRKKNAEFRRKRSREFERAHDTGRNSQDGRRWRRSLRHSGGCDKPNPSPWSLWREPAMRSEKTDGLSKRQDPPAPFARSTRRRRRNSAT